MESPQAGPATDRYEKPQLMVIDLAAEEVFGVTCLNTVSSTLDQYTCSNLNCNT
jgi:hypothetical protein